MRTSPLQFTLQSGGDGGGSTQRRPFQKFSMSLFIKLMEISQGYRLQTHCFWCHSKLFPSKLTLWTPLFLSSHPWPHSCLYIYSNASIIPLLWGLSCYVESLFVDDQARGFMYLPHSLHYWKNILHVVWLVGFRD